MAISPCSSISSSCLPVNAAPRVLGGASRSCFLLAGGGHARAVSAAVQVPPPSPLHRSSRRGDLRCRSLFGLGVPELAVIAGVAALVFGPKKLPEIGRSIGKTVKSFQQAAKEFETELKKEPESASSPPPSEITMKASNEDPKKELEI